MNTDPRGYYAALHVTPVATQADIQRAFRALIRVYHPDAGTSDAGTSDAETSDVPLAGGGEDVRHILAAFTVLRNPLTRAAYDREGRAPDGVAGAGTKDAAPADPTPTADSPNPSGPRDIPVRYHRGRGPVLRVTPLRWERGPWDGRS